MSPHSPAVIKETARKCVRVGDQKFWFLPSVKLTEASAPLRDYATELGENPLIVTSHGRPIAALVPVEGFDLETLSLSTTADFLDLIERSRREFLQKRATHTGGRGKPRGLKKKAKAQ